MKKIACFLLGCVFSLTVAGAALAADDPASQPRKRARSLFGAPVNVNIAGAGSLPKGKGLTILNASFADKTRSKKGGGPDIFNQTWLVKLRYGLTDHLEIATTIPYINNKRSGHASGSDHIEGFTDQVVQFTFAPFQAHQGDPFILSFTAGVLIPTGNYGKNHLPGNGVWGGRGAIGLGKWFTKDIKVDTEVVWSGPFERGNQKVKRGHQYQWNVNARYLFDWWDIGLESTFIKTESGDKRLSTGTVNLNNGVTEWYVGPSMNFAWDATGMWAGVGVFFPVMQDVKGPSKVEDARFEFKIGKLW